MSKGDFSKAKACFESQLVRAREIGDRRGEGNALWNISIILDRLGNSPKAKGFAEEALMIFEGIEDPKVAELRAFLESNYRI